MTATRTASQIIVDEVTSWPGMEAPTGERGELSLRLGRREIGHLHGDHAAHFGFLGRSPPHSAKPAGSARTRRSRTTPGGEHAGSATRPTSTT